MDSTTEQSDTESFYQLEQENDLVIYVCDDTPTQWSRQCLGQADKIFLIVNATMPISKTDPMAEIVKATRVKTIEAAIRASNGDLQLRDAAIKAAGEAEAEQIGKKIAFIKVPFVFGEQGVMASLD